MAELIGKRRFVAVGMFAALGLFGCSDASQAPASTAGSGTNASSSAGSSSAAVGGPTGGTLTGGTLTGGTLTGGDTTTSSGGASSTTAGLTTTDAGTTTTDTVATASATSSDTVTTSSTDTSSTTSAGGTTSTETVVTNSVTATSTTGGDATCQMGVYNASDPPQVFNPGGGAHDPSAIEVDGTFYRFQTGGRIGALTSNSIGSGWTFRGDALPSMGSWLQTELGGLPADFWAPDVIYMGGKYHLYYSASGFGGNRSCIGHATLTTIAATGWVDQGKVICTYGTENYNAIDPDVIIDQEGTPWMVFGSFWDAIMMIQLDLNGNRVGTNIENLAQGPDGDGEGAFVVYRCGYYYLFLSHGICCPGAAGRTVDDLTYNIVVGRSQNLHGPYVDKNGTELLDGGGSVVVEGFGAPPFYAAGHGEWLVSGGVPYIIYHAYPGGNANEFRVAELVWDSSGWPVQVGP